jgi:aspartyl-tRNA synthetase
MDNIRLYLSLAQTGELKKIARPAIPKYLAGNESKIMTKSDPEDPLKDNYGDLPLIQSVDLNKKQYESLSSLSPEAKEPVWIRARVHSIRIKGQMGFIILREGTSTFQSVITTSQEVSKSMIKYASGISKESIIDIYGTVHVPETPIESCSISNLELIIQKIYVISRSLPTLPFQLEDANNPMTLEEALSEGKEADKKKTGKKEDGKKEERARVSQDVRLNNRYIDLRLPTNQALIRISAGVCKLFREFLTGKGFVEIHTPKLIAGTSEGGCEVFRTDYFGRSACLAQSPQLYKQMAIMSDLKRVFEVGPVFRAENSNTHRHLCEFMGLDIEMVIQSHYFEVLEVINEMFFYIFEGLNTQYANELQAVYRYFPFIEPFKVSKNPVMITFEEACALLASDGVNWSVFVDFDTPTEKKLGEIIKKKYETDFYVVHRYPQTARPFYTMICHDNPDFTCSYDVFMRGEEIISGAQRIHDADLLRKRALFKGIELSGIQDYINSFKYGAFPHGGCGVGLERVVMLFCGLKNIKWASMFPRDPKRLTP